MVTKWLDAGTIEETEDGTILWERASRRVVKARDISATTRRQGEVDEAVKIAVGDDDEEDDEMIRRRKLAQMQKEEAKARLAKLKVMEAEGRLVDEEMVMQTINDAAIRFRQQVIALPDVLCGKLVSMTDRDEIHDLLDRELTQLLNQMADEAESWAEHGE